MRNFSDYRSPTIIRVLNIQVRMGRACSQSAFKILTCKYTEKRPVGR